MIRLMAISEDGDEFLIRETEDETMCMDKIEAGLFQLFKDDVTFEIRTDDDAG